MIGQATLFFHLLGTPADLIPLDSLDSRHEFQKPVHRHLRVKGRILGKIANPALSLEWFLKDIVTGDVSVTLGSRKETCDDPHGGCLAGTIGPEKAQDLSFAHFESYVLDGCGQPVCFREIFNSYHARSLYPLVVKSDLFDQMLFTMDNLERSIFFSCCISVRF